MGQFFYEFFQSSGPLEGPLSFFRLLNYLSFRAGLAFLTAFLVSLIFGRGLILRLYKSGTRETAREETDISIQNKQGTPTMGGLLIIFSVVISSLAWCNLRSIFVLAPLVSLLWFGGIGFVDDRRKMKHQSSDAGLSRSKKLFLQGLFGLGLSIVLYSGVTTPFPEEMIFKLYVPFYKFPLADLSWFYVLFSIFVVLSISNAVNFADGLDGLAIVPASTTMAVYGVFAYVLGNTIYAHYLLYNVIPGAGELTVLSAAVIGAGLGFLWYNAHPAQIFMGDTGSQALGGLIATTALLLKQEFLFLISGGIFLAEALSVLLQDRVGIARVGKRFFFRAPLHHSFQYRGIAESTVVVRFWIVSVLLALLSMLALKIR